jgi:hypothetical protein
MNPTEQRPLAHVLGVDVDAIDMEGAVTRVTKGTYALPVSTA